MEPRLARRPELDALDCLGVAVARLCWEESLAWVLDRLGRPAGQERCSSVFIVNAHTLNIAHGDPATRDVLNSATLVLNDGVGLDLYARIQGRRRFAYNFNGTDLIPRLLGECSQRGIPLSVFLYGARPGRAEAAGRWMSSRYPGVKVVGQVDGYQPDEAAVVATINAAHPDLLLVALGNPLQEQWIARNAGNLDARIAVGVGALFDYLSGSVPRAPAVLRALRLEWLFRLLLEPRRMFHRYVIGNPLFLWRALAHRARRFAQPGTGLLG